MSEINDGGAAFPVPSKDTGRGMTLRDWFAGQALAGAMANSEIESNFGVVEPAEFARAVYQVADAMIAARDAAP